MKALALATVSMMLGAATADEIAPPPKATTLMTRDLPGITGKEMLVLVVEYPPGGVSPPHRHDASVFVYVLEGAVTMQVSGAAPVTLHAGETFYEAPGDVHVTSANASDLTRLQAISCSSSKSCCRRHVTGGTQHGSSAPGIATSE